VTYGQAMIKAALCTPVEHLSLFGNVMDYPE
jgi:hypothetical protein